MTSALSFYALAAWAPRDQEPPDVAERWLRMINGLQTLNPVFEQWYMWNDGFVPLALNATSVTNAIVAGVGRDEDGREDSRLGYRLIAYNHSDHIQGPRDFQLNTAAFPISKYADNSVSLVTPYGVLPDAEVVTFNIFRGAIVAQSEAFEATHAYAWPAKLADLWVRGRDTLHLPIAWISYIGPLYSHLVTPPATAIVERRPDGGLLMAATDETFSVDNPAHMAVARDIAAAVAPFNALPRPLGNGAFDQDGRPIR